LLVVGAACGGGAIPTPNTPPLAKPVSAVQRTNAQPAIDPITALSDPDKYPRSFIVPGLAELELDSTQLQAAPAAPELEVTIIDEQTSMVRVAVRIDGLAFALWTERARLLGIASHDQLIGESAGGGFWDASSDAPFAELRSGAHVRVLGHHDNWTQVRYLGALEIDGWMPDTALRDRTTSDHSVGGRMPTGLPTLLTTPGTVVRAEPKWVAREIAVMANGYFLDTIKEIDDVWAQVGYEDGDIRVRGFVSRRDPPGRVHKPHEAEVGTPTITANATVAKATCLYASQHGEPIGFLLDAHAAEISSGRSPGWYTVTFDTPWGPITFAATGTSEHDLSTCGPPVPPPAAPSPTP